MAQRNFIQEAIKGLSKEEFDELVRIFQLSYWKNKASCIEDVVNVDGANDGGTDIKVFKNKIEQKKCIQVTVQKQNLGLKIERDLKKVSERISTYSFSNRFEFFCTASISEDSIEKYKKIALEEYDIVLDIYEPKRLAQLNCNEVIEYIYSLHSDILLKPDQMNMKKTTKTLYDLLANGKYSSDIKNSLVDSVIISILYEKAPMEISELKKELEDRLNKTFLDIQPFVNALKTDQRVIKDADNTKLVRLSNSEYSNVKDILTNSTRIEKEFCNSFELILRLFCRNFG